MENEITWLVEGHVILNKVYHWDVESLADHSMITREMVAQSSLSLVHTLWDFTELASYPKHAAAIGKAVKPLLSSEKLGWVLVVLDSPMINFLSTVATGMYGVRDRHFKSVGDAKAFLQQQDTTLPAL